jgi:hypothetical protein
VETENVQLVGYVIEFASQAKFLKVSHDHRKMFQADFLHNFITVVGYFPLQILTDDYEGFIEL